MVALKDARTGVLWDWAVGKPLILCPGRRCNGVTAVVAGADAERHSVQQDWPLKETHQEGLLCDGGDVGGRRPRICVHPVPSQAEEESEGQEDRIAGSTTGPTSMPNWR
ncbi:hypothetical protein NDU88_002950 [Pleurodeles waltl]|uniref:Uncharacterized protein n=1 Tax=Pleurodeles waltl TaxID=8319 RepID=A0AAV7WRN0_PLEWA|nr:hypothetical protein NDU88_002950 [Pleurodeles waltl]